MAKAAQPRRRRIGFVIIDSRRTSERDTLGIQWAFTARQSLYIFLVQKMGYYLDDIYGRYEAIPQMEWNKRGQVQPSNEELELMHEMRSRAEPSPLSSPGCGCISLKDKPLPVARHIRRPKVSRNQTSLAFGATTAR